MSAAERPDRVGTAIIGGGITGLCLARCLAEEGAEGTDIAIFDDGRDAGSSANAGSLHVQIQSRFMQVYPDMVAAVERALPLYCQAVDEWRALSQALPESIELSVTGGLMVAENAAQLSALERKCAREATLGLPVEMLDRADLDRVAAYLGPRVLGAELCRIEGKMNPLAANRALRRAVLDAGVRIFAGARVDGIEPDGSAYRLHIGGGHVHAERVAIAAGAGAAKLARSLGLTIPVRAETLHMNVTAPVAPLVGHLVQHADRMITLKQLASGHIVIGGGWPAAPAGRGGPPAVLAESLVGNTSLAADIVPAVAGLELLRSWAGVNPTADGLSILGAADRDPGVFFSIPGDAGYTLGPLVARLVAGLMAGRAPAFDIQPYRPERFAA